MHLVELRCDGFRSLTEVCFRPISGINVIGGANGQGKTSLLEALLYLTTSKSHRTTSEPELVRHDGDAFVLSCTIERIDRRVDIVARWWQGAKRFRVNGVAQERMSEILGKANVVFFSTEDTALVKGSASYRRRFMDMELSQVHPVYLSTLQTYRHVLRQRNELLRAHRPDTALLSVWDEQLVAQGAVLIRERAAFIEQLSGYAAAAYRGIADDEELTVTYAPNVAEPDELRDVLAKAHASDIRRGMTTRGPHRDDLTIQVKGHAARSFASQGQQKSAALALKLAEVQWVKARAGEYPILMLDEVLSELDHDRARRLMQAIPDETQCLLTSAETDVASRMPAGREWRGFTMENGRLV